MIVISKILSRFFRIKIYGFDIYAKNIKGKNGLEIGGPSLAFEKNGFLPIYPIVGSLDDFSFGRPIKWRGRILRAGKHFKYQNGKKIGYQFIGDAIDLTSIQSKSYDFILASHVLEHIANPFRALAEWLRVLKDGGVLLLIVPHKDGTFDHKRPVTSLTHLIDDFRNQTREGDLTHLPEILELTDINLDPYIPDREFLRFRGTCNYEHRSLHHHVFDTNLIVEIFCYFNLQILSLVLYLPHHIIILGKKILSKERVDNREFLKANAEYRFNSPFPSDKLKR